MAFGKLFGAGFGWALGGPIGGILGFVLGSMIDKAGSDKNKNRGTHGGDFGAALLLLSASIVRADGKVLPAEIDYVKSFFVKQFGLRDAEARMDVFDKVLRVDIPLKDICEQIAANMEYETRLQLLHYLFGISLADGHVDKAELAVIELIKSYMSIEDVDFNSIKAMFYKDTGAIYRMLGVDEQASVEEIKAAYRKMAVKYHPDKVAHLGDDIQHASKEKFQQLNNAYSEIKKQKGFN